MRHIIWYIPVGADMEDFPASLEEAKKLLPPADVKVLTKEFLGDVTDDDWRLIKSLEHNPKALSEFLVRFQKGPFLSISFSCVEGTTFWNNSKVAIYVDGQFRGVIKVEGHHFYNDQWVGRSGKGMIIAVFDSVRSEIGQWDSWGGNHLPNLDEIIRKRLLKEERGLFFYYY